MAGIGGNDPLFQEFVEDDGVNRTFVSRRAIMDVGEEEIHGNLQLAMTNDNMPSLPSNIPAGFNNVRAEEVGKRADKVVIHGNVRIDMGSHVKNPSSPLTNSTPTRTPRQANLEPRRKKPRPSATPRRNETKREEAVPGPDL